jgi:hypothetical protein
MPPGPIISIARMPPPSNRPNATGPCASIRRAKRGHEVSGKKLRGNGERDEERDKGRAFLQAHREAEQAAEIIDRQGQLWSAKEDSCECECVEGDEPPYVRASKRRPQQGARRCGHA